MSFTISSQPQHCFPDGFLYFILVFSSFVIWDRSFIHCLGDIYVENEKYRRNTLKSSRRWWVFDRGHPSRLSQSFSARLMSHVYVTDETKTFFTTCLYIGLYVWSIKRTYIQKSYHKVLNLLFPYFSIISSPPSQPYVSWTIHKSMLSKYTLSLRWASLILNKHIHNSF